MYDAESVADDVARDLDRAKAARRRSARPISEKELAKRVGRHAAAEDRYRVRLLEGARHGDPAAIEALWREFRCWVIVGSGGVS